jgi:NADH:ubiquinone oxidoreductase subunit B-like Fe-S oxidoreductase
VRRALSVVFEPVLRWARRKGRSAIAVVGALPPDLGPWSDPARLPLVVRLDAASARQADTLVIVGRLSHKLAPFLVRAHAAMAQPATVLLVDLEPMPGQRRAPSAYATVSAVEQILPVDVVLRGAPPLHQDVLRALEALDAVRGVAPGAP